jgi:hypothetical protein
MGDFARNTLVSSWSEWGALASESRNDKPRKTVLAALGTCELDGYLLYKQRTKTMS